MNDIDRIEELFCDAMEFKSSAERGDFLDKACAGDMALRTAVEEKLVKQSTVEKYFTAARARLSPDLENLLASAAESLDRPESGEEAAPDEFLGARIGKYKVLQKIGEGGCGAVYMAEQDKPVQLRVAIKVIKLGMDTKNVIARFEAERQALAMMDHPNIARVLDAGATESGRPYFVMELVRGIKITTYADDNKLDTLKRLELFIQVCQAIQHAHQKGVIHRDIKPSNILVTLHDGVPVPKVIDFGIAKATEGKLTDNTVFTAYDQFIGTPAYMSPEQAEMSGLDVDTRSDIYSLGVLLYELLTGRPPFDQKELIRSGLDQMRRTLRETEPQKPSTRVNSLQNTELTVTATHRHVEPPKLVSLLKGDLDWIVMKALEKDRRRRYETANGLALDVQRYLNDEAIFARPPSRMYRLQKLIHRNRVVFAAGTVAVVALILGLGASIEATIKARREQSRAESAEKQEQQLRLKAEDRQRITQAAYLISQNRLEEADRLADEISELAPSLETESVLRSLGEWHAMNGRFDQATHRFQQLLEADKLDKSWVITTDLLMVGPVQIERKDLDGYERFRHAAIARLGDAQNPVDAERLVKICLLKPADESFMNALKPLAETAANSVRDNRGDKRMMAWRCVSLALMDYREGNLQQSREWAQKCLSFIAEESSARIATARIILALVSCQLGDRDEALADLASSRKLVESQFAKPVMISGSAQNGYWYDWLFARILLREADSLIDGASTNTGNGPAAH